MGGEGLEIPDEPGTKYTMKSENVLTYAHFMHDIGSLNNKPTGLSELFFENPEIAGGN
jgi:NitT/TauT family transport system substrate-binding protein